MTRSVSRVISEDIRCGSRSMDLTVAANVRANKEAALVYLKPGSSSVMTMDALMSGGVSLLIRVGCFRALWIGQSLLMSGSST